MIWPRLLASVMLAIAVDARAQSHEPAATSTAASSKGAPAAAAGHDPAAADSHAAPVARKKGPTVSRLAPVTPVAKTDGAHAPAAADTHAPTGYVATGARPRVGAAGGADHGDGAAARPKPVVSGLGATSSAAAAASTHADDPDAHAPAKDAEPPAAARGTPPRPARLTDVHERLAAALAEARLPSTHEATPGASDARRPRVTLTWPKPRWQVAWPAAGRVALTWPEPVPVEVSAAVPPPH